MLGLPKQEVIAVVEAHEVTPVDGNGRYDVVYRVCGKCTAKTTFPAPSVAIQGEGVPTLVQP